MIARGEYEKRFAIVMCLNYLIDDKFVDDALDILISINSDEYYVQMAIAWTVRNEPVVSALIGASKPEQVIENVAAMENAKFTNDEISAINHILNS